MLTARELSPDALLFGALPLNRNGLDGVEALFAHWAVVGALFAGATRWRWLPARDAGVLAVGLTGCGLSAVLSVVRGDDAPSRLMRCRILQPRPPAGGN